MKIFEMMGEEFKERALDDKDAKFDEEVSWAVLNGLVISYLKATKSHTKTLEDKLNLAVKKVIMSMPKYSFGDSGLKSLQERETEYFALCPAEVADYFKDKTVCDETIMAFAQKVLEISAEKGVVEGGKMTIADRGVSKASMDEFNSANNAIKGNLVAIKSSGLESAYSIALEYFFGYAKKAVEDEVAFHSANAQYIIKFYSMILHSKRLEEAEEDKQSNLA